MICDMCRKQAVAQIESHGIPPIDEPSSLPSGPSDDDEPYASPQSQIDIANECLFTVGETPLTKRKMQSKTYCEQKYEKVCEKMHSLVVGNEQKTSDEIKRNS